MNFIRPVYRVVYVQLKRINNNVYSPHLILVSIISIVGFVDRIVGVCNLCYVQNSCMSQGSLNIQIMTTRREDL